MSSFNKISQSPGFVVIVLLAVMTVVEYFISTADIAGSFVMLTIIALVKAVLIIVWFMHVRNIFGKESS